MGTGRGGGGLIERGLITKSNRLRGGGLIREEGGLIELLRPKEGINFGTATSLL